jgi:hypothetical protein
VVKRADFQSPFSHLEASVWRVTKTVQAIAITQGSRDTLLNDLLPNVLRQFRYPVMHILDFMHGSTPLRQFKKPGGQSSPHDQKLALSLYVPPHHER